MHKAIRYIGSKQKVLPFLDESLCCQLKPGSRFFEGFSGSGIVTQHITKKYPLVKITGADISEYSRVLFEIINIGHFFKKKEDILNIFQEILDSKKTYGPFYDLLSPGNNKGNNIRNFFHPESAILIDTTKYELNKRLVSGQLTHQQLHIFLYFLLSYVCKASNTTSVYGAFLKSDAKLVPLNIGFISNILNKLDVFWKNTEQSLFYCCDILLALKKIGHQDIIYLDPPYSTRSYEKNYHILNYAVDLGFSEKDINPKSKAALPVKHTQNPFTSLKATPVVFKQMIVSSIEKTNILAISYNSDGVITQDWMENLCHENGIKLITNKIQYKRFKSSNLNKTKNELNEILWVLSY